MSNHITDSGRPYVECDERVDVEGGFPARCGNRTFGRRDEPAINGRLSFYGLPNGWSTAPYFDDYDHGATRTSLIDGRELKPFPHLIGVYGDLHTCPSCNKRRRR